MSDLDASDSDPPEPPEGIHADHINWDAKNWAELVQVWKGLVPEFYGNETGRDPIRRFKGTEVTPTQAGTVFERWVMEAFRLSGYDMEPGWSVPGLRDSRPREQIDGLVLDGWQAFLVECKFKKKPEDHHEISVLHLRVGQRPTGCLGLFFSAFGFTEAAMDLALIVKALRILLFNGVNLKEGIKSKTRWKKMIHQTWRYSVKYGVPIFVPESH